MHGGDFFDLHPGEEHVTWRREKVLKRNIHLKTWCAYIIPLIPPGSRIICERENLSSAASAELGGISFKLVSGIITGRSSVKPSKLFSFFSNWLTDADVRASRAVWQPWDRDREFILLSNETCIEVKVEMNIPRAAWAQGFRLLFTGAGEYEFKGDLLCIFFFKI